MASTPGVERGPHWWEASALTTAPPLLPKVMAKNGRSVLARDTEQEGGGKVEQKRR